MQNLPHFPGDPGERSPLLGKRESIGSTDGKNEISLSLAGEVLFGSLEPPSAWLPGGR